MQPYPADIEAAVQAFYQALSEKERRRYAAIEARTIGTDDISYSARLLGCSRQTLRRGMRDLAHLPQDEADSRQRRPGGGRKTFAVAHPGIDEQFLDVVRERTAGDPTDEDVRWTNLTQDEISRRLADVHGTKVSRKVISQLLRRHNYKLRKAQKTRTMKQAEHRDEQFQKITRLKADYQSRGLPVISIDTKKKELPGLFYREGRLDWPEAQEMLVLCDGGGSHSSRNYIVKQELTKELGLRLRMAHYPPSCSKYYPVEHRVFPHLSRPCRGVVFRSVELVKALME